ncbi:protein RD3-like [Littorina saxatilis]|uniref:Protein RD3-like n=1 Tax=Littorina saxatilis TaxID=31220 RepID=A0AAN9BBD4_9CAEN
MEGLRSAMRRGGEWVFGEPNRLPERNEQMAVAECLMAELDFHLKELNRISQHRQKEERRMQSGVDYSWLVAAAPKSYEIPQLERLELEELCLKLDVSECTKVISLFRDAILREPRVEDLARIMRSCVIQILEQKPQTRSGSVHLTEWMSRRASSLANLRLKSGTRVGPSQDAAESLDDIEMQAEGQGRTARAYSMPNFSVSSGDGRGDAAVCVSECDGSAYPV